MIIRPEGVIDAWWRQQGHALSVAEREDVMAATPDVLVVGISGASSMTWRASA
ncbi:MAG: hypothetical protein AB7N65_03485 [Vicinamibacterales bacterium]